MSTINRRQMLLGLAAASTAAASGAAANPGGKNTAPAENPKLIALAEEMPGIAKAYRAAADAYHAMSKKMAEATPLAPDELTEPGVGWPHDVPNQPGNPELLAPGGFLRRPGEDYPRRIVIKSWHVDSWIREAHRAKRRAKKSGSLTDFMAAEAEITRLKGLLATTRAYEDQFAKVKAEAAAGHEKLYPIKRARLDALERHVAAIMSEKDFTMEGLVIKAQALAEWDRVGDLEKVAYHFGKDWYGQIAASILRHAKGDEA